MSNRIAEKTPYRDNDIRDADVTASDRPAGVTRGVTFGGIKNWLKTFFDGVYATAAQLDAKADAAALAAHTGNTGNPHQVTAAQVGLGSVNNTADADKPVSGPQQAALALVDAKVAQAQGTANDALDQSAEALRGADLLKDRVDALAAVATLKGSVDTYADLPDVAGHNEGDTYVVEADETHDGQTSLYTATDDNGALAWVYTGNFAVDLSGVAKASDLEANVAGTQIVYLSETGDDSTGRVGTPLKPYRSWDSAWNPNVDVLVCGRGTFAVTSTKRLFIKGTRSTLIQRQNDFSIGGDYLIVVGQDNFPSAVTQCVNPQTQAIEQCAFTSGNAARLIVSAHDCKFQWLDWSGADQSIGNKIFNQCVMVGGTDAPYNVQPIPRWGYNVTFNDCYFNNPCQPQVNASGAGIITFNRCSFPATMSQTPPAGWVFNDCVWRKQADLSGKADLVAGTVPLSQLPAIPAARTAFVDANGDDATGAVGNAARPFRTAQAAYDTVKDLATAANKHLLKLGVGEFALSLAADYNQHLIVSGAGAACSALTISGHGISGTNGADGYSPTDEDINNGIYPGYGASGGHGTSGRNINLTSDLSIVINIHSYGGAGGNGGAGGLNPPSYGPGYYGGGGEGGAGGAGGTLVLTKVLLGTVHTVGGQGGEGGPDYGYALNGAGGAGGSLTLVDCLSAVNSYVLTQAGRGGLGPSTNYVGADGGTGPVSVTRGRVDNLHVETSYSFGSQDGNSALGPVTISDGAMVTLTAAPSYSFSQLLLTANDSTVTVRVDSGWTSDAEGVELVANRSRLHLAVDGAYYKNLTLTDCRLSGSVESRMSGVWGAIRRCTGSLALSAGYNSVGVNLHDCSLDELSLFGDYYGATMSGCKIRTVSNNSSWGSSYWNEVTLKNNVLPASLKTFLETSNGALTIVADDGTAISYNGTGALPLGSNKFNL